MRCVVDVSVKNGLQRLDVRLNNKFDIYMLIEVFCSKDNSIALFYLAHQGSCVSAGSKHKWGLYLSINVERLITTRL